MTRAFAALAAAAGSVGAGTASAQQGEMAAADAGAAVFEVTAEDYAFNMPESLPSGWVTLRFTNQGEEPHFVLLQRLPEGKTFDDYVVEVGEPFNEIWYPLRDGEITQEQAIERLGEVLPAWFFEGVEQFGGVGLVAPGRTAEATVKLKPGNYVVECYMKTPELEFHGLEGMVDPLTVTAEPSGGSPPEADVRLTVTNAGIAVEGEPAPGRHTVAVHITEHPEGGFPKHNMNVARLEGDASPEDVVRWINWLNVDGLAPPAPATFLGGVREMPAGSTGYFTVDLEPGRYLWISETTAGMGVWKEFTVR